MAASSSEMIAVMLVRFLTESTLSLRPMSSKAARMTDEDLISLTSILSPVGYRPSDALELVNSIKTFAL